MTNNRNNETTKSNVSTALREIFIERDLSSVGGRVLRLDGLNYGWLRSFIVGQHLVKIGIEIDAGAIVDDY